MSIFEYVRVVMCVYVLQISVFRLYLNSGKLAQLLPKIISLEGKRIQHSA